MPVDMCYSRLDELPPPLFALLALHPFLIQDGDLGVIVFLQLRKLGHGVLEDFIVDPVYGSSSVAEAPTDWGALTW